jgi:hypothetical protein
MRGRLSTRCAPLCISKFTSVKDHTVYTGREAYPTCLECIRWQPTFQRGLKGKTFVLIVATSKNKKKKEKA